MKPLVFFLLMSGAVMGQECNSIAMDKAKVEADGTADYLGVSTLPFTDGIVVLYRNRKSNMTLFSPVRDGCVSLNVYTLGPFKARVGV